MCALMSYKTRTKITFVKEKTFTFEMQTSATKIQIWFHQIFFNFLLSNIRMNTMYLWNVHLFNSSIIMFQIYNSLTFFNNFLKCYIRVLF